MWLRWQLWRACRGRYKLLRQRRSTQHSRQGFQQQQSVGALYAMSVAPALWLNLSKATWRHSKTSTSRLCSISTWSQSKPQWSTVWPNRPPSASTHAQCHSVVASQAPDSIYASISWWDILRILCAFQSRVPSPYSSACDVACRSQWRTSTKFITAQGCVRGGGRGSANMRQLCVPSKPLNIRSQGKGRNWREWRFSSTWGG